MGQDASSLSAGLVPRVPVHARSGPQGHGPYWGPRPDQDLVDEAKRLGIRITMKRVAPKRYGGGWHTYYKPEWRIRWEIAHTAGVRDERVYVADPVHLALQYGYSPWWDAHHIRAHRASMIGLALLPQFKPEDTHPALPSWKLVLLQHRLTQLNGAIAALIAHKDAVDTAQLAEMYAKRSALEKQLATINAAINSVAPPVGVPVKVPAVKSETARFPVS